MKKLKLLRFLFVLSIVLAVTFGVGLVLPDLQGNVVGIIALWCGFVSQLLLAAVMFSEIRKAKKGQDR